MHRWFIYFECKLPKTCAKAAVCIFAHFVPFWVKSQLVKRLPHSKLWACTCYLFAVTLCLICVVWPCIDDLYILNVSCQKLAPNLQFAYLHILRSATSVTVMFYLLNMYRCTVFTLLSLVVQRSCLNVAGTGEKDMLRLQFAHFGPFWVKSQSVKRLPHSKLSACVLIYFLLLYV